MEEVITPISLKYFKHSQNIVSGHNKGIAKLFDLNIPGDKY